MTSINQAHENSLTSRREGCGTNVGVSERWLSIAGAVGMLACAARQTQPLGKILCGVTSLGLLYRGFTGQCELYKAIRINTASSCTGSNAAIKNKTGVHVIEAMTFQQPIDRLYQAWRDFEGLPKILRHLHSVEILDQQRSRWTIDTPVGKLQWDAAIIEDKPNELISWKTIGHADVDTAGSVRFRRLPAFEATEVIVNLRYSVAGARLGSWLLSLFGESPEAMIREDLRRFKQVLETGEVATTQGQPSSR